MSRAIASATRRCDERVAALALRVSVPHLSSYKIFLMSEQMKQKAHIEFTLNGEPCEVAFAPHKTLLEVLREDLGLTGTKHGCELGECGTCAVLVDGRAGLSWLVLGLDGGGRQIENVGRK